MVPIRSSLYEHRAEVLMSVESELFRSLVPVRARGGLLHAIFEGCLSASEFAEKFPRDRLLDVLPPLRRVEVERRMADIAFGPDFAVELREAPSVNCLEIRHPRLVITAVSRTNWVTWVEPYRRRHSLALDSQLGLFRSNEHDLSLPLYALIVYGASGLGSLADQARVVFPTETGHFAAGEINLIEEHPEVVSLFKPADAPLVTPEVRLKPTVRRVADEDPTGEK